MCANAVPKSKAGLRNPEGSRGAAVAISGRSPRQAREFAPLGDLGRAAPLARSLISACPSLVALVRRGGDFFFQETRGECGESLSHPQNPGPDVFGAYFQPPTRPP